MTKNEDITTLYYAFKRGQWERIGWTDFIVSMLVKDYNERHMAGWKPALMVAYTHCIAVCDGEIRDTTIQQTSIPPGWERVDAMAREEMSKD